MFYWWGTDVRCQANRTPGEMYETRGTTENPASGIRHLTPITKSKTHRGSIWASNVEQTFHAIFRIRLC
jgi:hypothetical protein